MVKRSGKKHSPTGGKRVPQFTGSLDAKVPGENIIYVERITPSGWWYAVSQNEDGSLFPAQGRYEIGARRSAGLRALAYSRSVASAEVHSANREKADEAKIDLVVLLVEATLVASGQHVDFPASRPRASVMYQLGLARQTVESSADTYTLARYVGPVLCFLTSTFPDQRLGELGKFGFRMLERILAFGAPTGNEHGERHAQAETILGMRCILLTQAHQIDECIHLLVEHENGRALLSASDPDVNQVIKALLHMIGISAHSLVNLTDEVALGAKDMYPIARSIIEGAANIAYLMASDPEVARKAKRHAEVRTFRDRTRQSEIGGIAIKLAYNGELSAAETQRLEAMATEFTTAKGREKDWTDLSLRQRLDSAAVVFPKSSLSSLSFSAFGIYRHASEVVHGSYYGALMIWGVTAPRALPIDREEFRSILLEHQFSALSSSILAFASVVECFADYAGVSHLKPAVNEVLRRLAELPEIAKSLQLSAEVGKKAAGT